MSEDKPSADELFGDEDLPIEPKNPILEKADIELGDPEGGSRRKGPSTKVILIGLALIVLLVGWFLSSRNNDRFYIVIRDGEIHTERGYYFPFGSGTYDPTPAYEAFRLPAGVDVEAAGPFDAEGLDRHLHTLYVKLAQQQLRDTQEGDPDLAEEILLRSFKLLHTRREDYDQSNTMLGDVAFRRGLSEVRDLQSRFDEALRQFRLADESGVKHADEWVLTIGKLRTDFRELSIRSGLDPDKILMDPPKPAESKSDVTDD